MSKCTSDYVRFQIEHSETLKPAEKDMLTAYAERIAGDEAAVPVAYRFLGPDGEAVTEWDDTPITDKTFPDLCPPVGSVQHAYLHPPAQPPIDLAAIREVIAQMREAEGWASLAWGDKLSRAIGDAP